MAGLLFVGMSLGAACSSTGSSDARAGSAATKRAPASPAAPAAPAGGGGAAAATAADSSSGGAAGGGSTPVNAVPAAVGPRVVKKADLHVEVHRRGLQPAVDEATSIAERRQGYVAVTQVTHADDGSSGTLTIRVPAAEFDGARRELAELGTVKDERLSGDDVTAQLVDYDARITSLRAQEDALRTLLGRANAVGEVLQVQGQLFDVRRQIEQLQGQQAALADAADFSTIIVRVTEPGAPSRQPTDESRPALRRSLDRAWGAAVAVVGAMLVAVGVLVPVALLALLAWPIGRLGLRRLRTRATAS